MSTLKKFLNSPYSFIFAVALGMVMAVGVSVWATSVGTNITVTGTMTVQSTSASSSVATALGVATTTPGTTLSVVGSGYVTLGLGAGVATTTTGAIENTGNTLFGDASTDLVMLNAAYLIFNNAGTTTIPSASATSFAIATSSSGAFLRFDTTNNRLGISSSTPSATFSVGGNAAFGNTADHVITINAGTFAFGNVSTTTFASSANAMNFATSSANIPLFKFDTTNTRVGLGTSTPGAAFVVQGEGTQIIMGAATSSLSIHSTNSAGAAARGGCIELESAAGGGTVFRLYATAAGVPAVWESGSCR